MRLNAPGPTAVSATLSRVRPWSPDSASPTAAALCASSTPAGQLAVEPEQRLLAAGAVERTDATRLQCDRHQPLELGDLVGLDGPLVLDRLSERVEPLAVVVVLDGGADGVDLCERDLAFLASEGEGGHAWASSPRIAWSSCSKPPVSIAQCMPHSFGAFDSHHHRPARVGSPGAIARVQGEQPIEV